MEQIEFMEFRKFTENRHPSLLQRSPYVQMHDVHGAVNPQDCAARMKQSLRHTADLIELLKVK